MHPWKRGRLPHANPNIEHESTIQTWRLALGMSWADLTEKMGLGRSLGKASFLIRASQGMESPISQRTGKIKPWAQKLSEALGVPLEELFPREICALERDPDYLTPDQLASMSVSEYQLGASIPNDAPDQPFERLFLFLTPRQESVLRKRYLYGMTLEEVGAVFGVTRERIRGIEAKALRKLKSPQYRFAQ